MLSHVRIPYIPVALLEKGPSFSSCPEDIRHSRHHRDVTFAFV
jgi:hypothetical protein